MESLVAERERAGPGGGSPPRLAFGVGRDGLERLAWAGALDELATTYDAPGAPGAS